MLAKFFSSILGLRWIVRWYQQKRRNNKHLLPILKRLEEYGKGKFNSMLRRKIENYYAYYIPLILLYPMARIQNKRPTEKEYYKALLVSVLIPCFDDLLDQKGMESFALQGLQPDLQNLEGDDFLNIVCRQVQMELISLSTTDSNYLKYSQEAIQAQKQSLTQKVANIYSGDLEQITNEKGGVSALLVSSLLDTKPSDQTNQFIYDLGASFQWANDLFDIRKDAEEGIFTLASAGVYSFPELRFRWRNIMKELDGKLRQLPISTWTYWDLKFGIFGLYSLVLVALDHLSLHVPEVPAWNLSFWQQIKREKIMVDMALWRNRIKALAYLLRSL
jgi:hypothetical protein